VWVADNSEGWHGGGEYLRRVPDANELPTAIEFMSAHARNVRVMPFLEGIPCSIHGFVTSDAVAVFRPVEMLILWRGNELVYSGLATTWDPAPADREAMRSAAHAVGATLRSDVAYRGPFSLDGIMTADGFRPTEVNPRGSTGLGIQLSEIDDIPLTALTRHLTAYPDAPVDAGDFERRVLAHADGKRYSRAMFMSLDTLPSEQRRVRIDQGTVIVDDEGPIELAAGPALHGGLVFVSAEQHVVAPGASLAPVVATLAEYVESWLDFDIGPLTYARDVRADAAAAE